MKCFFVTVLLSLCLAIAIPGEVVLTVPWGNGVGEVGYEKWIDPAGEQSCGPSSFAVDASGNVFLLDSVNGRVIVYDSRGSFLSQFPLPATDPLDDIVVDSQGYLWVSTYIVTDNREVVMDVYKFTPQGELLLTIQGIPQGELWVRGGALFVVRGYDGTQDAFLIDKYDLSGNLLQTISLSISLEASKIVIDEEGNFYALGKEYVNDGDLIDVIEKYSADGALMGRVTLLANEAKELLDVDSEGNFYVLAGDTTDMVQKYSPQGELLDSVEISIKNGDMTRKILRAPSGEIYVISADPDEAPDVPVTLERCIL